MAFSANNLDLVVAGHTAIDCIVHSSCTEILPGGSAPAVATSACKSGVKVGLITKVGSDFPIRWLDALKKFIDIEGVSIVKGNSTFIKLEYSEKKELLDISISINVSENLRDLTFPPGYGKAAFKHVCPLPVNDQVELVKTCSKHSRVSVDFNQVYAPEYEKNPDIVAEILENADIIFPNEVEAKIITGAENISISARILYNAGPSLVIITLKEKGALTFDGKKMMRFPAHKVTSAVDPTGCGDAFIGGFLSVFPKTNDLNKSMEIASYMAAKKIAKKGSWMIPHIDPMKMVKE